MDARGVGETPGAAKAPAPHACMRARFTLRSLREETRMRARAAQPRTARGAEGGGSLSGAPQAPQKWEAAVPGFPHLVQNRAAAMSVCPPTMSKYGQGAAKKCRQQDKHYAIRNKFERRL